MTAANSVMKATVIGSRSQTSRALYGARWYQAEPKATSATATQKHAVVRRELRRREPPDCRSPSAPPTRNGRLVTTFQKFGTPKSSRVSANRWYAGSWGIGSSRNMAAGRGGDEREDDFPQDFPATS